MSTLLERPAEDAAASRAGQSPFARIVSDFVANPVAVFGLGMLMLLVVVAIFAPLISPQNPYDLAQIDVLDSKLPPGSKSGTGGTFWLGTDDQGRDMLSAIFYGLRISLTVGAASTILALVIGLAAGLTAAYVGGRTEAIIMRIVDIQLSFPAILIALILIAVLGTGTGKVITALVTVQWAYFAHRVPSPAAELPAADDRHRDSAGRGGDCARSDAVVPGARIADHRAIAGLADRQRLSVPAVGKILDQLLSRHRTLAHDRQHQPGRRPASRRPESAPAEVMRRRTDPPWRIRS